MHHLHAVGEGLQLPTRATPNHSQDRNAANSSSSVFFKFTIHEGCVRL